MLRLLFLGLFLYTCCIQAQDTISVLFTGDVLLDRGVRPYVEKMGTESLFSGVSKAFRRADAVVINLECPLTATATPISKRFVFRGDTACAAGLRRAGVTHAAMANNHTNDQGRRGLAETYRHLKEAGIIPLGYGLTDAERFKPVLIQKKNVEVAIFNAVLFPSENWLTVENKPDVCTCAGSIDRLVEAIRTYHKTHPHTPIVAVLHWGAEFQTVPHVTQRIDARRLAEVGASAIIGHHPHVVQQPSYVGDIPVFYSLGNFVFDQTHPDACRALMAMLRFTPSGGLISAEALPVRIEQCRPNIRSEEPKLITK